MIVVVACVGIIIIWRYRLAIHCCVYTLSQSLFFNSPIFLPHRLRQKRMLSVPDSVDIKLCSTSCDGSEVTPSTNQGVEMIVEVSTGGEQSLMMPAIAIMYFQLWINLFLHALSDCRKPIPVSKFGEHVTQMHEGGNKRFELEYNVCGLYCFTFMYLHYLVFLSCCTQLFTKQPEASFEIAERPCNKARNRFVNIIPCKSHATS